MSGLPTGTVTFLFTDIVGSTRLWDEQPDAMRAAMLRHDQLIESGVQEHGGAVVRPRGEGDSRFAVFARASDAVAAACGIQRALIVEQWPPPVSLSVRMAMHTGEADLRDGDYYGTAVNRCARLRGIAHGGQMLVSVVTADLAHTALPPDVELRDLGSHRLKDLAEPEHVFQVLHPQLPKDFPPVLSLDTHVHNLPVEATPLIGRQDEVTSISQRLLDPGVRLVSVTGTGGTGKTRVALQVAAELVDRFAQGVVLVQLAALNNPALVTPEIARGLDVQERPGESLLSTLQTYLRDKEMLLVLDNFEQVLPAATDLGMLLGAAHRLKVLVTSRVRLRVYGEQEMPLQPLPVPRPVWLGLEHLAEYDAVRLFVDRARAAVPEFKVTHDNGPSIAEICTRLDGLPLAIELAASRIKLLPPAALSARLDQRLRLLVGGPRDRPARQQTLRGAIDWSYDLLDAEHRILFRRLGVFAGGCTIEAVSEVCCAAGGLQLDILDALATLVDESLLRQEASDAQSVRFGMLDTIREYALERLAAEGDLDLTQRAHADYFVKLGEQAAPELIAGPQHAQWIDRLDRERDNLRSALRWCIDRDEWEAGLRLGAAVWRYWFLQGSPTEGWEWLQALLALKDRTEQSSLRATALTGAGVLATRHGDLDAAQRLYEESLVIARAIDDRQRIAASLHNLGALYVLRHEYSAARPLLEQAVSLIEEIGDHRRKVVTMHVMGGLLAEQGDYAGARARLAEAQATCRDLQDKTGVAIAVAREGFLACVQGDLAAADTLCQRGMQLAREMGNRTVMRWACVDLAMVRLHHGDYAAAASLCFESLSLIDRSHASSSTGAASLELLACIAVESGNLELALELFGAGEAQHSMELVLSPLIHTYMRERWLSRAVTGIGEPAAQIRLEAGRALSLAEASARAQAVISQHQPVST